MFRLDLAVPLVVGCRWPCGVFRCLGLGVVAAGTRLDVEADEALGGGVADDDGVVPAASRLSAMSSADADRRLWRRPGKRG